MVSAVSFAVGTRTSSSRRRWWSARAVSRMSGADDPPIVAAPCAKTALRAHPAYTASIERLSSAEAQFLNQDEITAEGEDGLATFDWQTVIRSLRGNPA
jgi:hypothetical protein